MLTTRLLSLVNSVGSPRASAHADCAHERASLGDDGRAVEGGLPEDGVSPTRTKGPNVLRYVGGILKNNALPFGRDVFEAAVDGAQAALKLKPPQRAVEIRPDPAQLEADVRLLTGQFTPRDYTHRENLDALAEHLAGAFRDAGGRVEMQPFELDSTGVVQELEARGYTVSDETRAALAEANGKTYRNVIASFGPEEGPRVVVGAHYDACMPLPGADDNATGVAGLLEVARNLSQVNLNKRVDLVASTLEEPPTFRTSDMGSAVHAKSLRDAGVEAKMYSLEMLGYYSDEPKSQTFPDVPVVKQLLEKKFGDRGNFITVITKTGQARDMREVRDAMRQVSSLRAEGLAAPPEVPGIDFSDHLNYWNQGYPAVMITDTAFLRNQAYHTAEDTPDRLDYVRMGQAIQGVFNSVYQRAQ